MIRHGTAVGTGIDGCLSALRVFVDELYVAGEFKTARDVPPRTYSVLFKRI
jgi:hypothetical protein